MRLKVLLACLGIGVSFTLAFLSMKTGPDSTIDTVRHTDKVSDTGTRQQEQKKEIVKIDLTEAVIDLTSFLRHHDPIVRRKAGEKLVKIGNPAVQVLLERLKDSVVKGIERLEIVNVLGQLRAYEAADALLKELDKADSYLKRYVYRALGSTENPVVFASLCDGLSEKDPCLRLAAIEGLGELRLPVAVDPLIAQFSQDQGPEGFGQTIRSAVVKSLGSIRDKRAVPSLVKELEGEINLSYHVEVTEALGKIGDPIAANQIRDYLKVLRGKEPKDKLVKQRWQDAIAKIEKNLAVLEK